MPAQSSRDIPTEPRKDEAREQQAAIVEDADKTEQADRERIHGDGSELGLDKADPGAPR